MVYVITKEINTSICKLLDWLSFYKITYVRINDYVNNFNLLEYSLDLKKKKNNRDFFFIYQPTTKYKGNYGAKVDNQIIYEYLQGFFKNEQNKIGQILTYTSKSKYEILRHAKSLKLKVPDTIITNNLSSLIKFSKKHDSIITKPCHEIFDLEIENKTYRPYVVEIKHNDLRNYPNKFGISLFQNKIKKICDIKVFYFDNNFYSQAIFSQNQIESEVDFRRYVHNSPARKTCFKLPTSVEKKLLIMLNKLNYKIAVIDFILDINYELFFLEINPDGVFDSISNQSNYQLENIIAKYIYEKSNN